MIRSSIPVLVDSALRDLDPQQLVLFIQSFGIPVDSMTKLLQTLDTAVTADLEAVSLMMTKELSVNTLSDVRCPSLCWTRPTWVSWWRCSTTGVRRGAGCSPGPWTSTSTSPATR